MEDAIPIASHSSGAGGGTSVVSYLFSSAALAVRELARLAAKVAQTPYLGG